VKLEVVYVDELFEHDTENHMSLVRLSDGRFAVGASLHAGMTFLPLKHDAYLGESQDEAKAAYLKVAGKRKQL
jgi:hypothetical protein